MFTKAGIAELHGVMHERLDLLLGHFATVPDILHHKPIPGFGHSSIWKQLVHILTCEEGWVHDLQDKTFAGWHEKDCPTMTAMLAAKARISEATRTYLNNLTEEQLNATLAKRPVDWGGELRSPAFILLHVIKATNVDTGLVRSTTTTTDGAYLIQYLPVGNYKVEVNASGFKRFVQENVVMTVDQTQVLNVTLSVGVQSQTVTVTEAPPLVEINSAELGRTVEPSEIIGLPLVNRNAYAELSLTPGVQSNSASPSSNPSGTPNFVIGLPSTQVVVNGGIDGGTPMVSFYLDGGVNMTGLRNYGNPLPNPDALQEFRVETSDFSAQYGRMSGAVVTAITKSGTNQIHGSLFEFNRNTDLNDTPWNSTFNPPYHRNQFGGVVGGPVKRDKAFFLFSYGGLRQVVGQQLTGAVVPTTAEREGDFTADAFKVYMPGTSKTTN
jgi:hypothetical protein